MISPLRPELENVSAKTEYKSKARGTVVVVAPVHWYDDVRVFQKEAKTLAENGYRVLLLARAERRMLEDGVEVVPLPSFGSRALRFLYLPGILWRALKLKGDAYHLHNPDTLPLAVALKALGRRVVYDTHEDFSERVLIRQWIPQTLRPFVARAVCALESTIGRVVDYPIATQAGVARRLGARATLIENPPVSRGPLIENAFAFSRDLEKGNCFRVVYVGGVGVERGIFTLVDALERANEKAHCRLWLIGGGDEGEIRRARERPGWKFVDYLGKLPQFQAFGHVIKADAGFAIFPEMGGNANINSNKLYEYMLFGVPFVASDFRRWRQSVPEDCGLFVDPDKPSEVSDALVWMAEHEQGREELGARGRKFVLSSYNWEVESEKLLSVYRELLD